MMVTKLGSSESKRRSDMEPDRRLEIFKAVFTSNRYDGASTDTLLNACARYAKWVEIGEVEPD